MKHHPSPEQQDDLQCPRLTDMIDPRHDLVKLAYLASANVVDTPDETAQAHALTYLVQNPAVSATLVEAGRRQAFMEHNIHRQRYTFTKLLGRVATSTSGTSTAAMAWPTAKGPEAARLLLQSCATALLVDPVGGLAALTTDPDLARRVTEALAALPTGHPLKTHFDKIRAQAEATTICQMGSKTVSQSGAPKAASALEVTQ